MDNIEYLLLDKNNFDENSLDAFNRHQVVAECLRFIDGQWKYILNPFIEDWDNEHKKAECRQLIKSAAGEEPDGFVYFAKHNGAVVGYAHVLTKPLGPDGEYFQLNGFEISEPYRNKGIGKRLFALAAAKAKQLGAKKLYISAHSAKESQLAYEHLGCTHARWIYKAAKEAEPCDVQMECWV